MNNETRQYSEFVFRRLEEPFRLFGSDMPSWLWVAILVLVLIAGFVYIGVMYFRDSAGVGWFWSSLLGLMRASVYLLLGFIFLLPAKQDWEETKKESKVVCIYDVSGSIVETIDDLPDENTPIEKLLTRQDKVLAFHNNPKVNFIPRLEEKNPVTAYRFGRQGDLEYRTHNGGKFWPREQWEKRGEMMARGEAPPAGFNTQPEFVDVWLKPTRPKLPLSWVRPEFREDITKRLKLDDTLVMKEDALRGTLPDAEKEILPEHKTDYNEWFRQVNENRKQAANGMYTGTAVGDSINAIVRREMNNMVQGIILFTDGRSTEGAAQAYKDLAEMAKRSKIPLFVVGIASERQQVSIDIADLRVPPQIRPEDKFRTVVALTGSGMDNELLPRFEGQPDEKLGLKGPTGYQLALDITCIKRDKDNKEQAEDIRIVTLDKDGEPTKDPPIVLGKEIILTQDWAKTSPFVEVLKQIDEKRAEKQIRLKPSNTGAPASAQVEFEVEAETLMRAAGREVADNVRYGFFPDPNSEIRFRVRVPKDKREIIATREHVSDPADVRVLKRPLRILLAASSATREYQFLRSLFVREMDKSRAEVCIYIQPLSDGQPRVGKVQDVPPERLLPEFPTKMDVDKAAKPEEQFQGLTSYDAIITFDLDFTRLSKEQIENLRTWVDNKGGGLIVVGGSINTVQMTRPNYKEQMEPLLTLLPVILEDERVKELDRRTDRPWRLNFPGATPDMEYLKLWEVDDKDEKVTDEEKKGDFVSTWNRFFNTWEDENGKVQKRDNPESVPYRGMYTVYPSKRVKDNATTVATFADPVLKMPNGKEQPYLALNSYGKGKVAWIGSGELWRLRSYRESWHERFWVKLSRYIGGGSVNAVNRRITPVMSKHGIVNKVQTFEAKFENRDGQPLPRDTKDPPVLTVTLPPGVLVQRGDRVKINKSGDYSGKEGKVLTVGSLEGKTQLTVEVGSGETRKVIQLLDNEVEIVIPPLALKPKIGTDNDGWFEVEFQPKASGEYKLQLKLNETGDTYSHKLLVKESNPELDNVKPDFELMYNMASDAEGVLARVNDDTRKEIRRRLAKPKLNSKDSAKKELEKEKEEQLKLYFDLSNADLIPACMDKESKTLRNRGPVKDIWDDGPALVTYDDPNKAPVKFPVLLFAIVGLFSLEWLIRKLLRLA